MASTGTLGSSCPGPAWVPSPAPGCPASPAATRIATPTARPAGTARGYLAITRAPGKEKSVTARYVRDDRLIGALVIQAFAALAVSPGARAFCGARRARGLEHNDALRRPAGRLAGILHGCLKTGTCHDEAAALGHRENIPQPEVAA